MSESHRSSKRKAPVARSVSEKFDETSVDDLSSVPGTATYVLRDDGSFTQEERAPRRRRKFDSKRRQEVALVRKLGACEDCRHRKIRCAHALRKGSGIQRAPKTPPSINLDSIPDLVEFNGSEVAVQIYRSQEIDLSDPQTQTPGDAGSLEWAKNIPTPTRRRDQMTSNVDQLEKIIAGHRGASQQPLVSDPWTGLGNQFPSGGPALNSNVGWERRLPVRQKGPTSRTQPNPKISVQLPIRTINNELLPVQYTPQQDRTMPSQDVIRSVDYRSTSAEPPFHQRFLTPGSSFMDPLRVGELYSKDERQLRPAYESSRGYMPKSLYPRPPLGLTEAHPSIGTVPNLDSSLSFFMDNPQNCMFLEPQIPGGNCGERSDAGSSTWEFSPASFETSLNNDFSQNNPQSFTATPNLGATPLLSPESVMPSPCFSSSPQYNDLRPYMSYPFTPSVNLNPPSMDYGPSSASSNDIEYSNNTGFPLFVGDPDYGKPSRFVHKGEYDFTNNNDNQ